jgi:hypothetical protein
MPELCNPAGWTHEADAGLTVTVHREQASVFKSRSFLLQADSCTKYSVAITTNAIAIDARQQHMLLYQRVTPTTERG